jgi:hypothetical protein
MPIDARRLVSAVGGGEAAIAAPQAPKVQPNGLENG